jgi:hypothetical protein
MRDQFDIDLQDTDLLDEVELSISLMIAGAASLEHLSRDEIDELLGIKPVRDLPAGRAEPPRAQA